MLLLVLLCASYSVCIILGLSSVLSILNHLYSFCNHCLLFSTGKFEDNGDFTPSWSSPIYCIFTLLVAGTALSVAVIKLVQTSVMLYKETRLTFAITFKMTFWALLMVILTFTSGVMVSTGFAVWCGAVSERFSKGCQAAAASMTLTNNTRNQISVKGFYADLETSQFSVWSALVVWVFILTIAGRLLFVAHERANIRMSMARERSRYNPPLDHANQPSNLPHRGIT